MKSKQKGYTSVELAIVIVWILGMLGYIMNIYKILQSYAVVDILLILRCVGTLVFPLGMVLGYF